MGSGHVVRCLALADELRSSGWECRFICRILEGNFIQLIESNGFFVNRLPVINASTNECINLASNNGISYANWLQAPLDIDASQSIEIISSTGCSVLIVDHYALDHEWEAKVKP